jgi:hypothetical protein
MSRLPPKLRIEMSFHQDGWKLRLQGNRLETPVMISTGLSMEKLDNEHAEFRQKIEAILRAQRAAVRREKDRLAQEQKDAHSRGDGRPPQMAEDQLMIFRQKLCRDVLLQLAGLGRRTMSRIFTPDGLRALQKVMQATHPVWERAENSRPRTDQRRPWKMDPVLDSPQLPLLELSAEEHAFFPLDMLPLFNFRRDIHLPGDMQDMEGYAMRFPAASTQVTRLFKGRMLQTASLRNELPLPVSAFAYAGGEITAHERELGFLHQMAAFEGPATWLPKTGHTREQTLNHLADRLTAKNGGVVHLACHASTSSGRATPFLRLKAEGDKELILRLSDIQKHLNRRNSKATNHQKPLVFFNACGSMYQPSRARNGGDAPASFARMLWENGNVGLVGTEVNVEDSAAADMAKLFYHYLHAGYAAPRALQLARVQLLRSRLNPLGLIYSYYGPPGLKVSTAHNWSYPPVHS